MQKPLYEDNKISNISEIEKQLVTLKQKNFMFDYKKYINGIFFLFHSKL